MFFTKLKNVLRKIIPPSRSCFDRREELLRDLIRDQRDVLLNEFRLLQNDIRFLREKSIAGLAESVHNEIAELREKSIASLAESVHNEIAELREKSIAGLAESVHNEIAELRAKSIAGLAESVHNEIAELREKAIDAIMERINLFMSQFNFYFKNVGKKDIEKTINGGVIPLRFYRNIDSSKRNWGDELNINFLEAVSGGKVKAIRTSDKNSTDYNILSIGSICGELNWGSIIWGAGLISGDYKPLSFPIEVRAVRGPLTRKVLCEKGIDCPAVYGDPALLLPLFYQPIPKKLYKITVVPHYVDADSEVVAKYREKDGFYVVDVKDYADWRDVIDAIVSSDFVISSSLHGLVVAEAYGIPSLWVEFSDKILGKWFKYIDFYESIGKRGMKPVRISKIYDFEELFEFKKQWQKGSINLEPLLKSCPFPIVNNIKAKTE